MRFPPPIRVTAPLLALAVGLAATFFEYRLNLDLDLARHLTEVRQRADSNGNRLAHLSEHLLSTAQPDALQADTEGMSDLPQFEIAGVVDENGRVLADSTGTLLGQAASATPLAKAAALITPARRAVVKHAEDEQTVLSAHPFRLDTGATGWVLLEFDRAEAIAATHADARTQLGWMASAMALLGFALWAVLHFGFAARLGRLPDSVRALWRRKGGCARRCWRAATRWAKLSARVLRHGCDDCARREAEQVRLEREILEIIRERAAAHRPRPARRPRPAAHRRLDGDQCGCRRAEIGRARANAERGEDIGRQLREAIAETRSLSHGLAPVAT